MYNRYIPQPDGTYRRNQMQEPVRDQPKPPPRQESRQEEPVCAPQAVPPCQSGQPCAHMRPPHRQSAPQQQKQPQGIGIGSFFRQLLPKDFDTEDLLIVLLLLLMAGDCREDQNSALLTLALYLFM